ncbi:unnamed protein product [Adineta ricciae]|uniref:Uncharacterized protein n=1 Tax=Adineta ricciae TaxID=249248 RepID=A0A815ADE3_ADIRI|nr:unnamed protein product [Adineta ricciae]CAF1254407.1 unnamed protein product [Adineta ricciae]
MKTLVCVLCLIQITTSFVLNVTQLNSIVPIQQTVPMQDDTITVEPEVTQPMTTTIYESTTSSKASPTNIWTELKEHLPIVIAIGCGTIIIVIAIISICCYCKRKAKPVDLRKPQPGRNSYRQSDIELSVRSSKTSTKGSNAQRKSKVKCPYMKVAKEFVASLEWGSSYFDEFFDQCYCDVCYDSSEDDVVLAGNAKYVIPRGWARIGLYVDRVVEEQNNIWDDWIVTFHGTSRIAALSILKSRQFCLPGDKLLDGTILGIREGHIPGKNHIYTSPTIAYSSLKHYSERVQYYSTKTRRSYEILIVLQCRQKPKSFSVQRETVSAGNNRICPHIPNDRIEYYTEIRPSIVPYGLLLNIAEK